MSAARKPARAAAAGSAATGPNPRRRRRLQGFAYYVIYVPAVCVAFAAAQLFVALWERFVYNDDFGEPY